MAKFKSPQKLKHEALHNVGINFAVKAIEVFLFQESVSQVMLQNVNDHLQILVTMFKD